MGKIIGRIATVIILILCGMIIWRCCLVSDKSKFSTPAATEALKAAYADGESEILTVDVAAELADDGYFCAYGFYYNPESGEVQVAVRWNNSVYDYTYTEVGHEYSFYLMNETTEEKYPTVVIGSDKANMYNYRHLSAKGVKLQNNEKLIIVMDLPDDYESSQILKHAEQPFETYKLPKKLAAELLK